MGIETRHVVIGVVVAFISWALLTDWIPSLRWIPYAFVAGALATLAGILYVVGTTSRGVHKDVRKRKARVIPAFSSPKRWEEEKAALKSRAEYRRPIIFPEAKRFSRAVDALLDQILQTYVTSWYGGISPRPLFQHEIDRVIRSVLLTVVARLTTVDLIGVGVSRVLPIVTGHLKDFYDAEKVVRGKDLKHIVNESEELDIAITSKYRNGKVHSVASLANSETFGSQQIHLRQLIAKLLPLVLPTNMQSSPAVTVLIKEMVTCAVLAPVFQMVVDPDFWNQMIVSIGGTMLHDRKTVRKLRAALDQHAPTTPSKAQRSTQCPRLRPYDSERHFERFIRAIRHSNTVPDARRFRREIMSQLRRDSVVEGQDAAYLRRLETGKLLLDQKIAALQATEGGSKPRLSLKPANANGADSSDRKRQASFRQMLYDASGLSYFMEYMDRFSLMRLVQFWIVVDGFRNPLEGDTDEPAPGSADEAERMDIAQIYDDYLSKPELKVPGDAMDAVRRYLKAGPRASGQEYVAARRAVLHTQTQVYERMRKDQFESFKRTELYFKWLAIDHNPAPAAVQNKQTSSLLSPESPSDTDRSHTKVRRPPFAPHHKEPELRRAVLSSTDLRASSNRALNTVAEGRRSFDDNSTRAALFDDDVDDEHMTQSISSLRSYDSDTEVTHTAEREANEARAVKEMQAELDQIVTNDQDREPLFSDGNSRQSVEIEEQRRSTDLQRPSLSTTSSDRGKVSLSSLGLVGAPSSRGVFVDDLFAEEQQKFAEDDKEESDVPSAEDDDQVQEAAPGDLGLTEAIDALGADIERLKGQSSIVTSLTAKAELTNNAAELRILQKSDQSLQREIKRKEMQKQQYEVQESDSSLHGRAAVSIKSVMVGREDDGHEYALYVIEVRKQAGDNMPAATWAITRRYSQFHELHKRLRARFPSVRDLDFPKRQAFLTLQKDFLQRRRVTLERYLRSLLLVPAICRSREFRGFLSQSAIASNGINGTQVDPRDFVTRIYNSVSDGMEEFLGNIPVLDQLSVAGQTLISAASSQVNGGDAIDALDPATHDPATAAEAEVELNAYETKELEPFVKPICDLFLETFELSKGKSWLRGRTVVVILHQLLGGTIERKVREMAKAAMEDDALAGYITLLQNVMWPDGKARPPSVPRSAAEKARTRKEAGLLLDTLIPDMAGSIVGRANAKAASRKIMALLNNQRLNVHLVFTLLDEIMRIVFPETLSK